MSIRDELLQVRRQNVDVLDTKVDVRTKFRAVIGDGEGNVYSDPTDLTQIYIRRWGRGRVERCLCTKIAPRNDLRVWVGYTENNPKILQVLDVDEPAQAARNGYTYMGHHHQQHELYNPFGGDDVVYSNKQQLLPGLIYPTDPESERYYIGGDYYIWNGAVKRLKGGVTVDMTGFDPGVADTAVMVLIGIDGPSSNITYTTGVQFGASNYENTRLMMVPAIPNKTLPLAAIYVENGATTFGFDVAYDLRSMLQTYVAGADAAVGTHNILDGDVHIDTHTVPCVSGALIVGHADDHWSRLVHPAAVGRILTTPTATTTDWTDWHLFGSWNRTYTFSTSTGTVPTIPIAVAADQVAYYSAGGADVTLAGDAGFTYDAATDSLFLGALLFINETANANMTYGATFDQGTADDEIMNWRSSDVGAVHSLVETNTFGMAMKADGSAGGLALYSFRDADGGAWGAMLITGYLAEAPDTTKGTAGRAITEVHGYQTDGTNVVNTVANGNVWALRTYRGGATTTLAIVDEDGDMWLGNGLTLALGTNQDYLFTNRGTQGLAIQGQTASMDASVHVFTHDGDATDGVYFICWGMGLPASTTNRERLIMGWINGPQYEIYTEANGTGTLRPLVLYTEGNANQLYLATDGNVGIGTAVPGAPLEIFKNGAAADTTGGGLIVSRYDGGGTNYRGGAIYSRYFTGFGDALVFGVTTANAKNPYSDLDQIRMVIGANGNVGIGTTEPDKKLHIAAANEELLHLENSASAGNIEILFDNGTGTLARIRGIHNAAHPYLRFDVASTIEAMIIDENGNVGIGTTNPTTLLELEQSTTLTGNLADGYTAGLTLDPGYTGAWTVTRHNYIDVQDVSTAGGATVTNSAVLRFDAAIGVHSALAAAFQTTDSNGDTTNWATGVIININGALYKLAAIAL